MTHELNTHPKRLRGAVLSLAAYQRLEEAKRAFELKRNYGYAMSLGELSIHTDLSRNTLLKIHGREKTADISSLHLYFKAFGLRLNNQDYFQPGRSHQVENSSQELRQVLQQTYEKPDGSGISPSHSQLQTVADISFPSHVSSRSIMLSDPQKDCSCRGVINMADSLRSGHEIDWTAIQSYDRPVYISQLDTQQNLYLNNAALTAQSAKPPSDFLRSTAHELNYDDELVKRCYHLKRDAHLIEYEYEALRWFRDPDSALWIRRRMQFISNFYKIIYLGQDCWLGEVLGAATLGL
jgi:hypothetical protein